MLKYNNTKQFNNIKVSYCNIILNNRNIIMQRMLPLPDDQLILNCKVFPFIVLELYNLRLDFRTNNE